MAAARDKELDAVPLLDDERSTGSSDLFDRDARPWQRRWSPWVVLALVLGYLPVIVGTYFGTRWIHDARSRPASVLTATSTFPTLERSGALKFEQRVFPTKLDNNPYAGEPRPELDAAWHDIFEDVRFKVSSEDLAYYNVTSVPFQDGSGFAAEFGMHHELHCLKKVRHWIFRDYYLADETPEAIAHYRQHIHHCLEFLREGIMCRADTSLFTFEWIPADPPYLGAVANGPHTCVNWDSLMTWLEMNRYPIFEPGVLAPPESST